MSFYIEPYTRDPPADGELRTRALRIEMTFFVPIKSDEFKYASQQKTQLKSKRHRTEQNVQYNQGLRVSDTR